MNIFILDKNTTKSAQYHMNKHLNKMILESAQLLFTAMWELGFNNKNGISYSVDDVRSMSVQERLVGGYIPYLPTHKNHPCAVWVRESPVNMRYLYNLMVALNKESNFRAGRETHKHASLSALDYYITTTNQNWLTWNNGHNPDKMTPFVVCMDPMYFESFTHNGVDRFLDPVASYRKYYKSAKSDIADWGARGQPEWW